MISSKYFAFKSFVKLKSRGHALKSIFRLVLHSKFNYFVHYCKVRQGFQGLWLDRVTLCDKIKSRLGLAATAAILEE